MTRGRFDLIAFDGDDTLWHNEIHYRSARDKFRALLTRAGVQESDDVIEDRVNETELRNLTYYGYGVSSFVLSLIETSIELTGGRISGRDIQELLHLSKEMITVGVELFDGAWEAVVRLAGAYPLMLITKGDLLHQRAKIDQSGLGSHFRHVEVVSNKTSEIYAGILARYGIEPSRFLMIGNSIRSDVLPVIEIGGWAVHIPAQLSWSHEDGHLPDAARDRCFALENLGQLPGFVDRLAGAREP
jgi:putative hydrolase of the HAD superfamily